MNSHYHTPVLLNESVEALSLKPGAIIVDGTTGGGGHSYQILKSCPYIRLFCFDQDDDALKHSQYLQDEYPNQVTFIHDNFAQMRTRLALEKVKKVDGIILDLGVSSFQLDTAAKGFSYMQEGSLDMRMNKDQELTAADIVNDFAEKELQRIFFDFGEEKESIRIARAIVKARKEAEIDTTTKLVEIIDKAVYSHRKIKARSRIFQALRIEVNSELTNLNQFLNSSLDILNIGGRLVILTYHSLEDRIVKKFFHYESLKCVCPTNFPRCVCQKVQRLKVFKPVKAGESDAANIRARSAMLRYAERLKEEE